MALHQPGISNPTKILRMSTMEIVLEQTEALKKLQRCKEDSLDENLEALSFYGNPTLMKTSNGGWWCYVKMHISAIGASFDVKSESNHKCPNSAVRECAERIFDVLRRMPQ